MKRQPLSRRSFLKGAGGLAAAGSMAQAADAAEAAAKSGAAARVSGATSIELSINGVQRKATVEPRTTLLSVLRHHMEPALTGAKVVCDEGACGACTVIVDGRARYACMTLALDAVGRRVRTVEGLGKDGALSPVQQAFWEEDALMCGFCTPGFVMSVTACLERDPKADVAAVRNACSGNLCRCGTYPRVFDAALKAGRRMRGEKVEER
jgi:aerobic-type carbon monoxide dehydrogenase small subunit (CoxS/CutS family)